MCPSFHHWNSQIFFSFPHILNARLTVIPENFAFSELGYWRHEVLKTLDIQSINQSISLFRVKQHNHQIKHTTNVKE